MLALIAGRGELPTVVAEALPTRPLVCALAHVAPTTLVPDYVFRLEKIGGLV